MRQAATRTAQVRVNCFGLRTDRGWQAQRGGCGRAGWGQRRGQEGESERESETNRSEKGGKGKGTEGRREGRGGGREGREVGKRGEGGRKRFVQKGTSKVEETKLGNLLKVG